ncbi:MAG: hypothetical protein K1X67_06545 [Fimbriimonadaceae bacterium]|nr:hypothetical protein [Fimbriimonadaceae bacterium]
MVDPVVPSVPTTRMQFASPYAKIVTREGGRGRQDQPDREPHDHVELHEESGSQDGVPTCEESSPDTGIAHIDVAA